MSLSVSKITMSDFIQNLYGIVVCVSLTELKDLRWRIGKFILQQLETERKKCVICNSQ